MKLQGRRQSTNVVDKRNQGSLGAAFDTAKRVVSDSAEGIGMIGRAIVSGRQPNATKAEMAEHVKKTLRSFK